jgi:hypothetical protein
MRPVASVTHNGPARRQKDQGQKNETRFNHERHETHERKNAEKYDCATDETRMKR